MIVAFERSAAGCRVHVVNLTVSRQIANVFCIPTGNGRGAHLWRKPRFSTFLSLVIAAPRVRLSLALFTAAFSPAKIVRGWAWVFNKFQKAISNDGHLHKQSLARVVFSLLRYVAPLLILVVMLNGVYVL